jgi:hypothetical protein
MALFYRLQEKHEKIQSNTLIDNNNKRLTPRQAEKSRGRGLIFYIIINVF